MTRRWFRIAAAGRHAIGATMMREANLRCLEAPNASPREAARWLDQI